jgi:saccharopine dehydrogenase-like NADP-dependent oxidoreductase
MKYVVLGGAGAMGSIIVKDLAETCPLSDEVIIADYDRAGAKELANSYRTRRVKAVGVDVTNKASTVKALRGAAVVINSVTHHYNIGVMEAALAARVHYVDLGGLFYYTRKQLKLNKRFKDKGLTALLCMGAAPGITNILARDAADRLDKVREIHIRSASRDQTRYDSTQALPISYSFRTIMEEFSFKPPVFTKGKFKFIEPMSGLKPHRFPKPVGVQSPMFTIHSETATLPLSFKHKGVKEVSFKIAFDPTFIDRVRFLRDVGLGSDTPIQAGGVTVPPIDVTDRVIMAQPEPRAISKPKEYDIERAIVKGTERGKKVTWVMDCHSTGMPSWDIGVDVSTGSPPAIGAQMIANGEITLRGVVPPERAVPPKLFYKYLKKRRMRVVATKKKGWDFSV